MGLNRFSNRPGRVKRFQTFPPLQCRCRSRVRASLRNRHQGPSNMGSEDKVEQSHARPCRQANGRSKRFNELTSSIVPRGTCFHRSGGTLVFSFAVSPWVAHAHAGWASFVQRNSVPSTHIRCMTTAIRRATATTARFIPRCRAIFMPQAFSQHHLLVRVSMAWAASNSTVRIMASPHFEMPPIRSISPDWFLRGVSPKMAPTVLEFVNRAGTSTVALKVSATTGPQPALCSDSRGSPSGFNVVAAARRQR